MLPHRRRKRRSKLTPSDTTSVSPPSLSPITIPPPSLQDLVLIRNRIIDDDPDENKKKLSRGSSMVGVGNNSSSSSVSSKQRGRSSLGRTISSPLKPSTTHNHHLPRESSVATVNYYQGDPNSCWEFTGMNFIVPAMTVWTIILLFVWYAEIKDNALDYYYLQYPEQQPLSPIHGTVLPLIPSVWIYDPDDDNTDKKKKTTTKNVQGAEEEKSSSVLELKKEVQQHLRENKQPHYYMLPQDFYDQQPPTDNNDQTSSSSDADTDGSNTALEAPPIRGVLIVLHKCDQSGLHFFQLPESRIVAAHALQRGLAIFSPSASSTSTLVNNKQQVPTKQKAIKAGTKGAPQQEKSCWSASLDGDELLGPLVYEWAREMNVVSLPRMAIGISNGANLIIDSALYKTLRLQSIALYGSHHPVGFDPTDLERDVVPPTTFVVFPKNRKATEFAMKQFSTLQQLEDDNDSEEEKLRKEEERAELEKERLEAEEEEEDDDDDDNSNGDSEEHHHVKPHIKTFFRKNQLYSIEPHYWTPTLCQARLPEYHTRCRSFFRYIAKYQIKKQRKAEAKEMKRDPQQRIKRLRLSGLNNAKQRYQLISSKGEVFQSSKSPAWNPVMEALGLDDWTTHIMAFTLQQSQSSSSYSSTGPLNDSNNRNNRKNKKRVQQKKKKQLRQFPTTATPEGRSWLWASFLQEIEVAYGMQDITSEFSVEILDFLMYHAGLSQRGD